MNPTIYDCIVIGAGQSGLATAYYLQEAQQNFIILEKSQEHLGSWANYYDSLTLFSPVSYSALPGLPFPEGSNVYPHRDEVVQYLKSYAAMYRFPIYLGQEVIQVDKKNQIYTIQTASGEQFFTRAIICASGSFVNPYIPDILDRYKFRGEVLHSKDYRNEEGFPNKRVIVVGGGNSAVQIAVELAKAANVTMASRGPIKFKPQIIAGKDIHFWLTFLRLDRSRWGKRLLKKSSESVLDTGKYKKAINQGKPDVKKMFKSFTEYGVVWEDETHEQIDTVIFATGYISKFEYLSNLGIVDSSGIPATFNDEKIYFVGVPWQTSFASATLRGAGKDAQKAVRSLLEKN
ncbi:NAD(P)/FAD-dependent oxidoreductase [Saccharibacillus sp. JS10]|uniref:flavin-containing monooxygenase n=1 Tax=Saccharibacillus sp. JS10 TaxID=2950552 RepID=UPI002109012B|nr:NAD(P)/FAD-dependent oxidoreductase [Saccharibacillus sp. JS10]MCQ4086457.1 NAD(P)/FAD-dependent oxidoreductase [Saccharibacillus sp. JS10]